MTQLKFLKKLHWLKREQERRRKKKMKVAMKKGLKSLEI